MFATRALRAGQCSSLTRVVVSDSDLVSGSDVVSGPDVVSGSDVVDDERSLLAADRSPDEPPHALSRIVTSTATAAVLPPRDGRVAILMLPVHTASVTLSRRLRQVTMNCARLLRRAGARA